MFRLSLAGNAELAANEIAEEHPDVVFTSGRRTREDQAHAMAANIARNRRWVEETYLPSFASKTCQQWVDEHPEAIAATDIESGLCELLMDMDFTEVAQLSRHLLGLAFDVKPVGGVHGELLLLALRRTVAKHGGKLLEREGGLVIWHAQFPK